ncbi:MAG: branched-chain amino acid ABC transporter substrate-binding protein [Deltaproteobacteria bacterium]|nr:branched-chain amino acid ABC transporter substrate-binding protein [Deltaproteobacteria bacterium]
MDIAPGSPIKLGGLLALSGFEAPQGIDGTRAAELALEDWDRQILGHPIILLSEDTGCSEGGGATAALKLVADPDLVAILAVSCSSAAVPAAKIMSEAGLTMISGDNTLPSLTSVAGVRGADSQAGYFRTIHNDVDQGRAAASFAFQELGVRKVATIDADDPYTQGLAQVFARVFTELGGEVVLATAVNKGDENMEPVLTAVANSQAELVFFPIFHPEAGYVVTQAQQVPALDDVTLMGAEIQLRPDFIEAVGPAGIGLFLVGPATPTGEAYDDLVARYKAKYGEPPIGTYHAQSYDATHLLLSAIAATASQDEDGTLHVHRQALRDWLYAVEDFDGLTGRLSCDAFGDCGAARFNVVLFEDPRAGLEGLTSNVVYSFGENEDRPGS